MIILVLSTLSGCNNNHNSTPQEVGLIYEFNEIDQAYGVKGYNKGYLGYSDEPISIVIPNIYDGFPVDKILDFAFENLAELTSIIIPDSITYIGESVFSGCYGLMSLEIPNSVANISENAFNGISSGALVWKNVLLTLENYHKYFSIGFDENGIGMYLGSGEDGVWEATQYHQTTYIKINFSKITYFSEMNLNLTLEASLTLNTPFINEIEHGFGSAGTYNTIVKNESVFVLNIPNFYDYGPPIEAPHILSTVKFLDGVGQLDYADIFWEYAMINIEGSFSYDIIRTGLIVE